MCSADSRSTWKKPGMWRGPHPRWSCQLGFAADAFDQVIPWLMLNRQGLTIFTHAETGDHLADHRDHALWMGELLDLDLSIFDKA